MKDKNVIPMKKLKNRTSSVDRRTRRELRQERSDGLMDDVNHLQLLDKESVARLLSVSPRSVDSPVWRSKVQLPYIKIGGSLRFRLSDVEALIARGEERPLLMPTEDDNG